MARYNLIMSDKTYMKLITEGAAHGKTVGRLINDILNTWVSPPIPGTVNAELPKNLCCVCKKAEATVTLKHEKGYVKGFCQVCAENAKTSKKWEDNI